MKNPFSTVLAMYQILCNNAATIFTLLGMLFGRGKEVAEKVWAVIATKPEILAHLQKATSLFLQAIAELRIGMTKAMKDPDFAFAGEFAAELASCGKGVSSVIAEASVEMEKAHEDYVTSFAPDWLVVMPEFKDLVIGEDEKAVVVTYNEAIAILRLDNLEGDGSTNSSYARHVSYLDGRLAKSGYADLRMLKEGSGDHIYVFRV